MTPFIKDSIEIMQLSNLLQESKFRNTLLSLCTVAMFSACACGNQVSSVSDGSNGDEIPAGFAGVNDQLRKTAGDRVFFKLDKSELTHEAKATLDKQVSFIQQNPNLRFSVEGHCDERGPREYNIALGERRAVAAKNYLVAKGVSADRLTVVSFGKERPEADGHNEAAWSQNRRSVTIAVSSN